MRVAGVNVKAGSVFVAVLDWAGDGSAATPGVVASNRFQPNASLGETERFADLRDRVRQFMAPLNVGRVDLVETRQFAQWKYTDAYARVMKICAVMDAARALGVPFSTQKTGDIARTLKMQAHVLQVFDCARVGLAQNPTYWTTGLSEAAAVALHVLGDPAAATTADDDAETA